MNFPKHSLTWIVKGTFDLKPAGAAVLAADQAFPTGDEFYPDDAEQSGSPRYESDFACHKPRADLLLVGACHGPNGKAVTACPVVFRVGKKSKSIGVIGNRRWERHWLTSRTTESEPFTRMELRYENSFGGAGFPANPVGKGLAETTGQAGEKIRALPNLEDPANLIIRTGDRPPPAGFGPMNRKWPARNQKLGTYKGAYLKTRWPWFPEDFDWTYLNAAAPDLQLDGYLRGDEQLAFENLHPQHAYYESQLPGFRVRCFVQRTTAASPASLRFEELNLNLDTLWIDMEAEKLVLVWRGWTEAASEEYEDIQDVYVTTEPLAQPPATVEQHHRKFKVLDAEAGKPFEPEIPPEAAEPVEEDDPAAAAARQAEKEELLKALQAQATALNAHLGLDKFAPEAREKALGLQAKMIERIAENDPAKSAQLAGEAGRAELRATMGKLGLNPDSLPVPTEKAQAESARLLAEMGLNIPAIQGDPQFAGFTAALGAVLGRAGMNPEFIEPMVAEVRKLKKKLGIDVSEEPVTEKLAETPPLTRESVVARHAEKGSFEGANLQGLDLSGLDLTEADFSGANLAQAQLRKTNLSLANLSKTNLTGADLSEANLAMINAAAADFSGAKMRQTILKESDLTGAKLPKADLTKAILDGTLLENADLRGAILTECSASGTLLPRANLTGAILKNGRCTKADFTGATLNQTDFERADLTEASLGAAAGQQVNFTGAILKKLKAGGGCDLTGARLVGATGEGSIWKGANLTGADLRYAVMEDAIFTSACLKQADLSAANMKYARFNKANLSEAKMRQMNLFQGSLEKADLTRTDLSGANLYEVEVLNAVYDGTVADGANVKMTKLDRT